MKEVLMNAGWMITHECRCGGVHRIEFNTAVLPAITIKVYPDKGTYKAISGNRRKDSGDSVEQLKAYIDALAVAEK